MYKFIVLIAVIGIGMTAALPIESEATAETRSLENEISPEGVFHYAFQTSNGIDVNSAGDLNAINGAYNYVSPEGEAVHLTYVADENGFQPAGDHLPTPPPVPEAIIRSLAWIAAHPPTPEPLHG